MKDKQAYLKYCLMRIGLDPTHKGCKQLIDCVFVQYERHYSDIGSVYAVVAGKYGIHNKSVMRNITYALKKVEGLGNRLSELLGFTVNDFSLHNGSVIDYLADYITFCESFNFSA